MNSHIIKNRNIQLYSENFGSASNPAILLIGGSMCSCRFWTDDFCNQLANAGYFIIRYDQRDTGLSSAIDYTKNPYSLNDLATDAIAILDGYKIDKTHIVGGSMGSLTAQVLALDHTDRVLSLTLCASGVFTKVELNQQELEYLIATTEPLRNNKPTKIFEESIDGFLLAWQGLHGDIPIDKDVATVYTKDMYTRTKPEHLSWLEKLAQGIDPAHNHEILMLDVTDRTAELKKIKQPTLIIHGQKDCLFPARIIERNLVKQIPNSVYHSIPEMGHIVFNKKLFTTLGKLIIDFLKNLNKKS
jgi:pimeloyl-ACP methyl ester carboxylesterase